MRLRNRRRLNESSSAFQKEFKRYFPNFEIDYGNDGGRYWHLECLRPDYYDGLTKAIVGPFDDYFENIDDFTNMITVKANVSFSLKDRTEGKKVVKDLEHLVNMINIRLINMRDGHFTYFN